MAVIQYSDPSYQKCPKLPPILHFLQLIIDISQSIKVYLVYQFVELNIVNTMKFQRYLENGLQNTLSFFINSMEDEYLFEPDYEDSCSVLDTTNTATVLMVLHQPNRNPKLILLMLKPWLMALHQPNRNPKLILLMPKPWLMVLQQPKINQNLATDSVQFVMNGIAI